MIRQMKVTASAAVQLGALSVALSGSPAAGQVATQVTEPQNLSHRLPAQLVTDFHEAFGDHHARAVHTKGVILTGHFAPDPHAASLSRAQIFKADIPIIVRFSDFTGIPDIPDTTYDASPRGFAVKFLAPDGSNLDVVSHSFNGFPVRTAAEFSRLLQALGASPAGSPKPTAFDGFLGSHPTAKTFFSTQKAPPQSWATTAYFSVNAFQFTNAAKRSQYVRYRFVPEAGEHELDVAALKAKDPNYLAEEISERVRHGPIRFGWYAQLAQRADVIDDPSIAWPESRKLVKLGVLSIDRLDGNTQTADRSLLFLPGSVPSGIAIADPMLTIRNAAYPVSFHQRQ